MILVLLCLLFMPSTICSMDTTFNKPSSTLPKIHFSTPGLTSFEFTFSRSKSTESFNDFEQRVPLLAFNGPEDLLSKFIDPSLPRTNTAKVGQAIFSGTQKILEYNLSFSKNFNNGIFLSMETIIADVYTSDICLHPVSKTCLLLAEEEINQNTELKNFIDTFYEKFIPHTCSVFHQKVWGPSFFTLGYAKNWQHFTHIDFINFSIKAGLAIPVIAIDDVNPGEDVNGTVFRIPAHVRFNYGLPLQANVEVGFLDWLNIGACTIIIPYISNDTLVRLNPTRTNNVLFAQDKVLSKVHNRPFVYINSYIEAEEFLPKLSMVFGLSYAKQFETYYCPHDSDTFVPEIVNQYSLHKEWERAALTLETKIDFATEEKTYLPTITFSYVYPFYGRSTYAPYVIGSGISFDIMSRF